MTDRPPLPYDFHPEVPSFNLESDDVAQDEMMSENQVFDGFGMTGGNTSWPQHQSHPRFSRPAIAMTGLATLPREWKVTQEKEILISYGDLHNCL